MKNLAWLVASLAMGVAAAADMKPILSNGPARSLTEERANKAMGLMLHRTLIAEGDPQLAADMVMCPQFINHDVEEPSGAQNFANFFLKPKEFQNPNAQPSRPPHAATTKIRDVALLRT